MEWKKREERFTENLDEQEENRLKGRFVFAEGCKEIEAFYIGYVAKIREQFMEIIRFDGSKKEPANVHRFYLRKKQKQFLEKPVNRKTMEECRQEIRKNWRIYRAKFIEAKGL